MGEILRDAVSATFTPSLNGPEKSALVQIATHADDYTGETLSASGDIRQSYIGLCEYLPEPTRQRPRWFEDADFNRYASTLERKGWIVRLREGHLDGAIGMNISRLVRVIDFYETVFANNYHLIPVEYDEHGHETTPEGCEDFADPLLLPIARWADRLWEHDFETPLLSDVTREANLLQDAHCALERDDNWVEEHPERWTRAIADWKDCFEHNRTPAQWEVLVHDC